MNGKNLTRHISCKYKCKFDGKNYNPDQWWNNYKCQSECKKRHVCEKDYVQNPPTCNCENGKYLVSIMVIQRLCVMKFQKKSVPKILNEKKPPIKCKISIFYQHFYYLLQRY